MLSGRPALRAVLLGSALLLVLSGACSTAAGRERPDEILVGLRWSTPGELQQLRSIVDRVRFVTAGKVLVSVTPRGLQALRDAGYRPFLVDRPGADDEYFLFRPGECAGHAHAAPLYSDRRGWALARLGPHDTYPAAHFLYPLPQTHSIRGWVDAPARPKPARTASRSFVAALMGRVDQRRLEHDLRFLALLDTLGPSQRDNLRTRFVVRPETYDVTRYLRDELAAALGDSAATIQEFAVDADRLSGHLAKRVGEAPVDLRAYNVVGQLEGTDPDAGFYVVCAHYDATGVRTPNWDWRTDPAPGADDNGTGTALVLETARALQGVRLPWSVQFVLFSGEEEGLLGSRHYAELEAASGLAVLGVLDFDMFGYNHLVDRLHVATNPASRWLADLLANANQEYGVGLRVDVLEDAAAVQSDHAAFWARGYDAVLGIENYLPNDPEHAAVLAGLYRVNDTYHTLRDVPDSLDFVLVAKVTRLAVAALGQYAQGDGPPNPAVFTGDVQLDRGGRLRCHVGNIGTGPLPAGAITVRLSHCAADSTDCSPLLEAQNPRPLLAGEGTVFYVDWPLLGDAVFLLEVRPGAGVQETSAADDRIYQRLHVQPAAGIAAYPNPYHLGAGRLVFAGVPRRAVVRLFSTSGGLVWSAREDGENQRSPDAPAGEVWWNGANGAGKLVSAGLYLYTISTDDDHLLARARVAVVR